MEAASEGRRSPVHGDLPSSDHDPIIFQIDLPGNQGEVFLGNGSHYGKHLRPISS